MTNETVETMAGDKVEEHGNNEGAHGIGEEVEQTFSSRVSTSVPEDDTGDVKEVKQSSSSIPDKKSVVSATTSPLSLLEEEMIVRTAVDNGPSGNFLWSVPMNGYSALLIFLFHLISLESILSIGLSVGMTVYTYNFTDQNESYDGSVMSWVLLSFAVITPMSASIGMAFRRRDLALEHLAVIKSTLLCLYSAHAVWDWCSPSKKGRAGSETVDWSKHGDDVLSTIVDMSIEITRLLTLPNFTRGRHRVTVHGRKESTSILTIMSKLHRAALHRISILSDLCEVLKREGLPPNEATRVRQWERIIVERLDRLVVIKKYRTPQALRSFARLFSVFLPPFYAPYYGQIAKELNSLGMAIAFAVVTSLALTSLFESVSQIEDPFVGIVELDGINVSTELQDEFHEQLLDCRKHNFPNLSPYDLQSKHSSLRIPSTPSPSLRRIRLFQT